MIVKTFMKTISGSWAFFKQSHKECNSGVGKRGRVKKEQKEKEATIGSRNTIHKM